MLAYHIYIFQQDFNCSFFWPNFTSFLFFVFGQMLFFIFFIENQRSELRYSETFWYFVSYNLFLWLLVYYFTTINIEVNFEEGVYVFLCINSFFSNVIFLSYIFYKEKTIYKHQPPFPAIIYLVYDAFRAIEYLNVSPRFFFSCLFLFFSLLIFLFFSNL